MIIKQDLISASKYDVKCPYSMTPIGITVHNTANDASAKNEIAYMKNNNNEVSYHIAVDDIEAIQGIPFNRNAWHCGDGGQGIGNRQTISIEICYSKSGGDRFIKAEKNAAKVIASLLKQYGWSIDVVKSHNHYDRYKKYCPHRTLDLGWERFINLIKAELNGASGTTPKPLPESQPTSKDVFYRVVAGSYSERKNAESIQAQLKSKGYDSFLLPIVASDKKTYLRVIVGSYNNKASADKVMNELISKGFNSFIAIYEKEDVKQTISTPVDNEKITSSYKEKGKATILVNTLNVRDLPHSINGKKVATYSKGEVFYYDSVFISNNYVWVSYISITGQRRYVAIKDKKTNEKYANCV